MDADSPQTILIVDDDQGLLRLMERTLQREGFITATAGSGKDAIDWLARNTADLMLLDLKLQDIGGRELINHLTSVGRLVPFIIITGQGDERVAVDMMKRGALDYLVKDAQFIDFLPEVVRRALDQLAGAKRLAKAETDLRQSEGRERERSEELAALFDSVPIPVFIAHDPDCLHITGNRAADELLRNPRGGEASRTPPEEARPRPFKAVKDGRELSSEELPAQRAARGFPVQNFEFSLVFDDGTTREMLAYATPLKDEQGRPRGAINVLVDITERKRMEKEVLEISEREQSRIGQDLHDGLCQHLAGIEFRLLGLKQKLQGKSKKPATETAEIARLVREGIEQTRTLARGLSPVMLEADGLMNALHQLAIDTENAFEISCSFNCPAPVSIHDNAVATHLYRIAQEAVQNAIRHGKAKFIVINLFTQNARMVLAVKDDGVGLPTRPRKHHGMGLRVMQYRAGMVGGSLVVQREPEGGTSVVCSLRAASVQERAQPKGKRAEA